MSDILDQPAVKGAASEKVTALAVLRAARNMQRAGLPFATGPDKRTDLERYIDTGKVKSAEYFTPARRKYDRKYQEKQRRAKDD